MKIIIYKHNYMIQILYNKHWYLHVYIVMFIVERRVLLSNTGSMSETICTVHSYVPESLDFSDENTT